MSALSEPVQVQLILVFGTITVAVVTTIGLIAVALINRTRQHAKAASDNTAQTRDEVKNDHKINLRDDIDLQFRGLNQRLDRVDEWILLLADNDKRLEDDLEDTKQHIQPRSYQPKE